VLLSPHISGSYSVVLTPESEATVWVTAKVNDQFTINSSVATGTVDWIAIPNN
jgi:hypothetical protein